MNAHTLPYLKSLVDCHKKMMEDGYTENFKVEDGLLKSLDSNTFYKADEVTIINFFRFEGQSDPEDSSILYVIETPDAKKGTIADAYGAYADPDISAFFSDVDGIHKKIPQV